VRQHPADVRGISLRYVLIAEDNGDTREMYALCLSMTGYNVETVENGHEAVIAARTLLPDLIVMDLRMPRLDGWGAIRELQSWAETAMIPILVLTGHDFKAYLKHSAIAEGAASYLMKPCFPDQLAREISGRLAPAKRSASRQLS